MEREVGGRCSFADWKASGWMLLVDALVAVLNRVCCAAWQIVRYAGSPSVDLGVPASALYTTPCMRVVQ